MQIRTLHYSKKGKILFKYLNVVTQAEKKGFG